MEEFLTVQKWKYYLVLCLLCLQVLPGRAQTSTANLKHCRIDVANGGLHCPFLGPQLVTKIQGIQQAQNVKLFPQESYISFELPLQSSVAEAELKQLAVRLGYPSQDVKVTFYTVDH